MTEEIKPSEESRTIIAARIKHVLHEAGIRSSEEFLDAVNQAVIDMCKKVIYRCKSNGRLTARICDL